MPEDVPAMRTEMCPGQLIQRAAIGISAKHCLRFRRGPFGGCIVNEVDSKAFGVVSKQAVDGCKDVVELTVRRNNNADVRTHLLPACEDECGRPVLPSQRGPLTP